MPVRCDEREGVLTALISGEVDHHGAKQIMWELDAQLDAALPRRLVLDLEQVSFMDSSGIAVLLRAWRRIEQLEGSMAVVKVPRQAARVLRPAGLERLFEVEEL